jgi:ribokinase
MPPRRYDIVTIGAATRDVFLPIGKEWIRTSRSGRELVFPLGQKIDVGDLIFETGGGATNTAVGFTRLGFRTAFVGRIGSHDTRGRAIVDTLKQEGVDTSLVIRDPRRMTAYSLIMLTPKGERTIFVQRGASAEFKVSELPFTRMTSSWWYISSLSGNIAVLRALIGQARHRGIRIAFNPGARELALGWRTLMPLLRHVDITFINDEEARMLAGARGKNDERAFQALCWNLPGMVVVTRGSRGASVCDEEHQYISQTHRIALVNTTGAGDAFGCGFLAGYIKYKGNIARSLQMATANSESIIQHIGAKAGLLRGFPSQKSAVRVLVHRFPTQ